MLPLGIVHWVNACGSRRLAATSGSISISSPEGSAFLDFQCGTPRVLATIGVRAKLIFNDNNVCLSKRRDVDK